MKKSKKKLKGMTLIEMIISIAIFAIMGGLLVLVGTHIDNTTKATNKLKNKIVEESPYAANHVKTLKTDPTLGNIDLTDTAISITVIQDEASGNYYVQIPDPNDPSKKIFDTRSYCQGSGDRVDMTAKKYTTEDVVTDGMTAQEKQEFRKGANGGLNLDFIEIDP